MSLGVKETGASYECCLVRVDENARDHTILKLKASSKEVTVGRSPDATVTLLSSMISRKHALLSCNEDNVWNIMDMKTLNGIYVNGKVLGPGKPQVLMDGDTVQFGVPIKPTLPAEFVFKFHPGNRNSRRERKTRVSAAAAACQKEQESSSRVAKREATSGSGVHISPPRSKRQRQESHQQYSDLSYLQKVQEGKMTQQIQDAVREVDHLKSLLAAKEETLNESYTLQKDVEKELEEEMRKKEQELNQVAEKELKAQMEKLTNELADRELRQTKLETELTQMKAESVLQQQQLQQQRAAMVEDFEELLESELQCSICSELFIEATTLGCSHSFCASCIGEWMKRKRDCPNCRAAIASISRSVVLDSYINSTVAHLGEDLKRRREEIVSQRSSRSRDRSKSEGCEVVPEIMGAEIEIATSGRMGTRSRARVATAAAVAAAVAEQPVYTLIISSEEDDDDDDDDNNDDDDDDDNAMRNSDDSEESDYAGYGYYGGGACFNCGRRGHWARFCPYR
ncbi:PREDICTED: E3 ubiquitin-protein ligase RNF8-like [Priapulus caudatus]|uniref:E3 ubiquitin-protein ligase CHFR n=1 Tax=Priapulus caudatus TaxID=37621 RepID=A0ABM1E1I6_PRICU|nr:PREDICTED: E3 ubiquitin-protein ligase RNF8-like [Priapulus caudatus]